MPKVFISYRQSDTRTNARAIHRELEKLLGKEEAFLDEKVIGPGKHFPSAIRDAVTDCDLFVIMIGPTWATTTGSDGKPRLEDTDDWVKRELLLALQLKVPVIPVLVRGAKMPEPDEIPFSLRKLPFLNAISARQHSAAEIAELIVKQLPAIRVEFDLLYNKPRRAQGNAVYWIGIWVENIPRWVKKVLYKLSEEHKSRVCKRENPTWTTTYGDFEVVATMYDSKKERTHSVSRWVSDALKQQYKRDTNASIRAAITRIANQ